ncbi:hypothetical protein CENSYa_0974 [Cenarchaeum symbiosum A]|uniref:Uncharacterized protein n=1 Tax=Cenarchaeum symbiosum (strain A) TaxID=414004 RepID=A0RW89_CENSY|nr:hypothetical protein CENSYa_0974 [Cenarchaeum symbiosum A]
MCFLAPHPEGRCCHPSTGMDSFGIKNFTYVALTLWGHDPCSVTSAGGFTALLSSGVFMSEKSRSHIHRPRAGRMMASDPNISNVI